MLLPGTRTRDPFKWEAGNIPLNHEFSFFKKSEVILYPQFRLDKKKLRMNCHIFDIHFLHFLYYLM